MLPPRVGEHARRIVIDQLDVRHQGDPRVKSLEQVVREEGIVRDKAFERRDERVDVVQPLAGEDAFSEQILIGVGHRSGVRIDAGVA